MPTDDWSEYRLLIVSAVDDLKRELREVKNTVTKMEARLAVWSSIAGFVAGGLGTWLARYFSK